MKRFTKIVVSMLCAAIFAIPALTACDNKKPNEEPPEIAVVDYVSQLTLNQNTDTKKVEVTVRNYVDGDTTHFNPKTATTEFDKTDGYIKARYLAINTPESTGKIEEWGKAASKFTRSKLESADSIIVESDDNKWNIDSTGSRYLLWVWYKPTGATEYRNLNVEILQNGYALASSTSSGRYGTVASNALDQAKRQKLNVYSGEKDPDFFYGDAIPLTMRELRCHISDYEGKTVAVEGTVVGMYSNSVYAEDYDGDEDIYFGISVYYGASASGDILRILSLGNRVRIVGTVNYYETGDTYQISGVTYNPFKPNADTNCQLISTGNEGAFREIDVSKLNETRVFKFEKENEEGKPEIEEIELKLGEAMMSTSVSLNNLTVKSIYTTETGGEAGAMSITCETEDGKTIVVRTAVLKDNNNKPVTQDVFEGKIINVKGIVDKYKDAYQVFCTMLSHITVVE